MGKVMLGNLFPVAPGAGVPYGRIDGAHRSTNTYSCTRQDLGTPRVEKHTRSAHSITLGTHYPLLQCKERADEKLNKCSNCTER